MWQKIELYILSLAFLFILILANQIPVCFGWSGCQFVDWRTFFTYPQVIPFCILGLVLCIIFFFRFKYRFIKGSSLPAETITAIESVNYENLTFLATYVIPLVCFDLDFHLTENRNFLMLILVLILIGWIYIKTNIFYTNPTLAVLGFRVYKISTNKRTGSVVVITKQVLTNGNQVRLNQIDDKTYFGEKYGNR